MLAAACASALVFARQGTIDWRHAPHMLAPAVTGAVLGALLASWLPNRALAWGIILAVVMSLIVVLVGTNRFLRAATREPLTWGWLQMGSLLLIGIWAGLIVLDSYTYVLLTLVLAVGDDLLGANALKAIAGIGCTGVALAVFTGLAAVAWFAGGLLSLGGMAAAWVGATLAARERSKLWVFRVLVLTMGGEMVRLVRQEGAAGAARPVESPGPWWHRR
jgi:uncharacterized membrane protein YfcA